MDVCAFLRGEVGRECPKACPFKSALANQFEPHGKRRYERRGVRRITVYTRGYAGGRFEVRTALGGEALGSIPLAFRNQWTPFTAEIPVPDGVHALYFTYRGPGSAMLRSFILE